MRETAIPTQADRQATRDLAARIVEAVRNDEATPLELYLRDGSEAERSIEDIAFQLAQEIELLRELLSDWRFYSQRHDVRSSVVINVWDETSPVLRDRIDEALKPEVRNG
jgi:hypothetical protein